MKLLPIIQSLFESLLMEANLINGKDSYNGVSIVSFLEPYTNGLATAEAKQMFMKKLSRLLMADERFLYAVRELPPNAPAWAQQALEKGDLVFFQPSDELKDNVENLSHYVASLEQDIAGGDANTKAVATREFQGFPKAESLDLLIGKVQEYFSRGSEKQEATNAEGMKAVLEAPGGYVWYRLEEPKAFYREGQTLQNCIGRNYTAENTRATNTVIYVLRDSSNNSVVATRIKDNEMREVKGKNNQPPIPRYMPAVQKLINTFNITLASGGQQDVGNSGYYYHEGLLYSKPQAIAKLISVPKLYDIPGTTAYVGKVVSESAKLVADLYLRNSYYWREEVPNIYEARASDKDPLVAVHVDEKGTVDRIIRLSGKTAVKEADDQQRVPSSSGSVLPSMIEVLAEHNRIESIEPDIAREIYWNDGALWDGKTKTFSYRQSQVSRQHKPKQKGTHTLEVYEGPAAQQLVKQLQPTGKYETEEGKEKAASTANVKAVYTAVVRAGSEVVGKQTDKVLVVVEYKDGSTALYSVRGSDVDLSQAGFTRGSRWQQEDVVRDGKTVSTLMALANEQGFKLPKRFQVSHGLSYREGQYVPLPELTPTELPGDPPAVVFDLASLDTMDRATVLARAISINDTKPHTTPFTQNFKFRGVTQSLDPVLAGEATNKYWSNSSARDKDDPRVTDADIDKWTSEAFGTTKPTAIYRVNIKYGAGKGGKVSMVTSGKEVKFIDSETLDHTWQSRNDYQVVADQLNQFAINTGLTFARSATHKSPQLRVVDGKIVPAETLAKSRMEKRLSRDKGVTGRVGTVTFADGASAKKMDHEEFGAWSAHGIKRGMSGTPWEISDAEGKVIGVVSVTRDGTVNRVFANPSGVEGEGRTFEIGGRHLPVQPVADGKVMPYVKALAAEFGWSKVSPTMNLKGTDRRGKMLLKAYNSVRDTASISRQWDGTAHEYKKGSDYYNVAKPLESAGLITIRDRDGASYDIAAITQKGREVARRLRNDEEVSWMEFGTTAQLSDDYQRPAEPAPTERAPRAERPAGEARAERAPRAPMEGGGSKADRAMQLFRQMTDDNNGTMPTRSAFIAALQQPPFNMTPAGASTYQYNVKAKYMRERGDLNEHFTFIDFLTQVL